MPRDVQSASVPRVNRVGLAADQGVVVLKADLSDSLRAVAGARVERAVALCGGGVGAAVSTNKSRGEHAGLNHDVFSAHRASKTMT